MAVASIRFDQAANDIPTGQAGRARRDIVISAPVTLRNGNNAGVRRHQWTLLARPSGSSATIVNPTSAVATLTPDVHGWYRVGLAINTGQLALGEYQVRAFGVPDSADQARPAAGSRGDELNYDVSGSPNTQGWAREINDHQMWSIDNRDSPFAITVTSGSSEDFEIDWGLPDAVLQFVSVTGNTAMVTRLNFYRDAARTEPLLELDGIDPSTGYIYNTVTTLTGATDTLEDRKVYATLFNDGLNPTNYVLRWRLKAV